MKIEVISLGGSLIIPDEVNYRFLLNFKRLLSKFRDRKFVIVVGGGIVARKYIRGFERLGFGIRERGLIGIKVNDLNAWLISKVFGRISSHKFPKSMGEIRSSLKNKKVIFLGVLRFEEGHTSDSTAAEIARYFKTRFINITNVNGLYDRDPIKFRNAKLIRYISLRRFYKIANKLKYKPGQHFVLDQVSAQIILKHKIKTFIAGPNLRNLENLLRGRRFVGTTIQG